MQPTMQEEQAVGLTPHLSDKTGCLGSSEYERRTFAMFCEFREPRPRSE
jgi:hypothetical protein